MPSSWDAPAPGQKVRQIWTPEEDRMLSEAVAKETPKNGPVSWHKVAAHLPGRNNKDCRKRWHYSIANTIRKGTWMREEDEKLREAVEMYGARWSKIAEAVGTRNGDQCWKRWYDCLDPRIDKSPWSADEDAKLIHLVSQHGRNWSDIVHQHFPNRTSLSAKNRYSILRRKQETAAATSTPSPSPSPSLQPALKRTISARHAKSTRATPSSSSASTPTTRGSRSRVSRSPYLSVPTPSTSASTSPSATPEPALDLDFDMEMGLDANWMSLTEAEVDELLRQQGGEHYHQQHQHQQHLQQHQQQGWYAAGETAPRFSATPSPQMGSMGCESLGSGSGSWSSPSTAGFESGFAVSMSPAGAYQYAQQQHQQQQRFAGVSGGHGYNALGVYQGHSGCQPQGFGEVRYDTMVQAGMGGWQGGYGTGW